MKQILDFLVWLVALPFRLVWRHALQPLFSLMVEHFLTIVYYCVAIAGIVYFGWYTNPAIMTVVAAIFLSGMQWGELVEKVQMRYNLGSRFESSGAKVPGPGKH